MSGHTPGPWVTDPDLGHQSVVGPDGFMVADCGIVALRKNAPTEARCIANARLASAAPEMAEALKGYLWGQATTPPPPSASRIAHRRWRLDQAARAALLKADGQQ